VRRESVQPFASVALPPAASFWNSSSGVTLAALASAPRFLRVAAQ